MLSQIYVLFIFLKVDVGIDIMDIQNVDDKEYTITINAFFNLRWTDKRIFINRKEFERLLEQGI